MKKIIHTTHAPEPIGPYSQAVVANGMIYLSGSIAIDPISGKLNVGDLEEEVHQVMQNMKAVLEGAGSSLADVVKTSIFIKNMDDFSKINEVYSTYFESDYPARETVEVARLPKDVNVEISCIALNKS